MMSFLDSISCRHSKKCLYACTAVLSVLLWWQIGFYAEQPDDMLSIMFSGRLMPEPFTDIFYIAYNGIRELMAIAYRLVPGIPWFDLFNYMLLWLLSCSLTSELLHRIDWRPAAAPYALLFGLVLWVLLFAPVFVLFSHTKLAFLSAFCGLLLINTKNLGTYQIKGHVFFILGYLIRPEAALGAIVLSLPFFLMKDRSLLKLIRNNLFIGVFSGILTFFFLWQMWQDDSFTRQVEPDLEYQIQARQNIVPLSDMTNAADSAKYRMAQQWIVNDPEHISIEFLRSLIPDQIEVSNRWRVTWRSFQEAFVGGKLFSWLWLVLGVGCLVMTFLAQKKHMFRMGLAYWLYAFIVLIALIFLIKMEGRVWFPMVLLITYLMLFELMPAIFPNLIGQMFKVQLALALGLMLAMLTFLWQNDQVMMHRFRYENGNQFRTAINAQQNNKKLLVNKSAFSSLYTPPFSLERLNPDIIVMVHNFGTLSLSPQYQAFLQQECNCLPSNYASFYQFLANESYFVISNVQELELTTNYLAAVYGINIKSEVVTEVLSNLLVYRITTQ
jgi:hypothetical protein